ncbi:ArsR/SmtB family transcription factor [Streptomyces sp. NPDC091292]|uniref:ArsR/SmtB family transcription factor n=1 Tax=Streptomyces sp. NPDC091292 TaxID=3365991 RepID=UPI0037FF05BA
MSVDTFSVLSEPTRRRILDRLLVGDSSVNELVETLRVSQPTVSKHLKVLRDAGFVTCRTQAQQRIYRIHARPFRTLDDWLQPYRALWDHHLDALERHLDALDDPGPDPDTDPAPDTAPERNSQEES